MDYRNRTITVYTAQSDEVVNIIRETGCYYVKLDYIVRKYDSVSDVFLRAYRWYSNQASLVVPRPKPAESAVWTFLNSKYVEQYPGSTVLKLQIPVQEAVFFRMSDWNKVLNLRYIGDPAEEEAYNRELERMGIHDETDVYLKPYYPRLKKHLIKSWERLFRYDEVVKVTGETEFEDMQAGVWCLKREWIM